MSTDSRTPFARILAELSDPTAMPNPNEFHEHNPFALASLAECTSPDSSDSPGARFLAGIARDVAEHIDTDDMATLFDLIAGDAAPEIADNAVPIYTHDRWLTFVDLGAYNEDVTEYGDMDDLTNAAGVALYMIAERLVRALAEELSAALDEDTDAECESCGTDVVDPVRVDGSVYCEECAPEPADA